MKIKGLVITGCIFITVGIIGVVYARSSGLKKYSKDDIVIEDVTYEATSFTNMSLSVDYDNVKIIAEERDNVLVQNKTLDDITYTLKLEDNTLSIEQKNLNWFNNVFSFNIPGSKRNTYKEKDLIIKIPQSSNYAYALKINAGQLEVSNLTSTSFSAIQNAGRIKLDNIKATEAKIKLNAGELEGSNINVTNKIDVKLNAGYATFDSLNASELASKLNAGTCNYKNVSANKVSLDLSAGTCNYNGTITGNGNVKISAGSVNLKLNDSKENYTVNGEGNGPIIISVNKSAGSFSYSFSN